ncbi:MAG: hypothetical protein IJV70_05400, partial [Clostridia bacterium]|nr:hypothetical protein [Clostridia bacterium]
FGQNVAVGLALPSPVDDLFFVVVVVTHICGSSRLRAETFDLPSADDLRNGGLTARSPKIRS